MVNRQIEFDEIYIYVFPDTSYTARVVRLKQDIVCRQGIKESGKEESAKHGNHRAQLYGVISRKDSFFLAIFTPR